MGPRSAAVPGEVKGYWEAKRRFGNPDISWKQLIQPSIDLCNNGNFKFGNLKGTKQNIIFDEIFRYKSVIPCCKCSKEK